MLGTKRRTAILDALRLLFIACNSSHTPEAELREDIRFEENEFKKAKDALQALRMNFDTRTAYEVLAMSEDELKAYKTTVKRPNQDFVDQIAVYLFFLGEGVEDRRKKLQEAALGIKE